MALTGSDKVHLLEKLVTVFDDPHYAKLAVENRKQFQESQPFPHIVFDNFLPTDVAALLAPEYPDPNDSSVDWKTHSNVNVSRKLVEHFLPLMPKGGIVVLDEVCYSKFAGETQALREVIDLNRIELRRLPFDAAAGYFRVGDAICIESRKRS